MSKDNYSTDSLFPLWDFWCGFTFFLSLDERVNSTPGDFYFFLYSCLSSFSSANHSYPTQSYCCCTLPNSALVTCSDSPVRSAGITSDLVSECISFLPLLSEIRLYHCPSSGCHTCFPAWDDVLMWVPWQILCTPTPCNFGLLFLPVPLRYF